MIKKKWTTRRAMRWGSEETGQFNSRLEAMKFARADIRKCGNVGRIEQVIGTTVYYDVYESP